MTATIDYVTMIGAGVSVISFIANFIYTRFFNAEQKRKFDDLVEKMDEISSNILHPQSVTNTPVEADTENEPIDPDDYVELKPYFNRRTGKTEMLLEIPATARKYNQNVPSLPI